MKPIDLLQSSLVLILSFGWITSAAYIPEKKQRKSNHIRSQKSYRAPFKSDWDIARYLKFYGHELMLWRCRNAIQHELNWQPLDYIELYCEVIGRMKSVTWFHNGQEIDVSEKGSRYGHIVTPHYAKEQYYSRWIDFKLRVFNPEKRDAGVYTFRATDLSGHSQEQFIYVDVTEKSTQRNSRKDSKRKRKHHHKHRHRRRHSG